MFVVLAAHAEDHAQRHGGEEHRRAAARDERQGLARLGNQIDRHHDVEQRLARDEQRQAQHQQPRECGAAATENFDRPEENPQIEHQQRHGQDQSVLLDEEGVGVVALGVDHLHAHGALPGALAQDTAVVDGDHRTLRVGQVVDGLVRLRLGPQVDPRRHAALGRLAAPQVEGHDEHHARHGPRHQLQQLAEAHASDEHHHPRGGEDQHGRRGVGREDHGARHHHRHQHGPRSLAPDAALGRIAPPGPEAPRGTMHSLSIFDCRPAS